MTSKPDLEVLLETARSRVARLMAEARHLETQLAIPNPHRVSHADPENTAHATVLPHQTSQSAPRRAGARTSTESLSELIRSAAVTPISTSTSKKSAPRRPPILSPISSSRFSRVHRQHDGLPDTWNPDRACPGVEPFMDAENQEKSARISAPPSSSKPPIIRNGSATRGTGFGISAGTSASVCQDGPVGHTENNNRYNPFRYGSASESYFAAQNQTVQNSTAHISISAATSPAHPLVECQPVQEVRGVSLWRQSRPQSSARGDVDSLLERLRASSVEDLTSESPSLSDSLSDETRDLEGELWYETVFGRRSRNHRPPTISTNDFLYTLDDETPVQRLLRRYNEGVAGFDLELVRRFGEGNSEDRSGINEENQSTVSSSLSEMLGMLPDEGAEFGEESTMEIIESLLAATGQSDMHSLNNASEAEIAQISVRIVGTKGEALSAGSKECCPICLADFGAGDVVAEFPQCAHAYHRTCLGEWLRVSRKCPSCRREL